MVHARHISESKLKLRGAVPMAQINPKWTNSQGLPRQASGIRNSEIMGGVYPYLDPEFSISSPIRAFGLKTLHFHNPPTLISQRRVPQFPIQAYSSRSHSQCHSKARRLIDFKVQNPISSNDNIFTDSLPFAGSRITSQLALLYLPIYTRRYNGQAVVLF